MNAILIYWILGCLLIGSAIGHHWTRCPNDKIDSDATVLIWVAIWPTAIGAILVGYSGTAECKP